MNIIYIALISLNLIYMCDLKSTEQQNYCHKESKSTTKDQTKLGVSATLGGVGVVNAGLAIAPKAVGWLGFGGTGVVAGSWAALWQSFIGNVAAGSTFASLQAFGATAVVASVGTIAAGVVAPIAAAAGVYIYFSEDKPALCPEFTHE